jgi:hypothetical protein
MTAILFMSTAQGSESPEKRRLHLLIAAIGMVLIALLCFAMAAFYAYTQGFRTIGRVLNVIYLVMVVASVLLASQGGFQKIDFAHARQPVAILLLLTCFATFEIRATSHVRGAYAELRHGEWAAYDREMNERAASLESRAGQDVIVPAIATRPWTLFVFDISPDTAQRYNHFYAHYYSVGTIRSAQTE